jgi:deoxyribodipyrimidine photolyase
MSSLPIRLRAVCDKSGYSDLSIIETKNISCHSFKDQVIFEEKRNNKADGLPYTIYTPYKKCLAKI